jgi:hypothetical protein
MVSGRLGGEERLHQIHLSEALSYAVGPTLSHSLNSANQTAECGLFVFLLDNLGSCLSHAHGGFKGKLAITETKGGRLAKRMVMIGCAGVVARICHSVKTAQPVGSVVGVESKCLVILRISEKRKYLHDFFHTIHW